MLLTNSQIRDTLQSRTKVKVVNGVKISEMGIVKCISIANNVESYKKFNEKAQTANFSYLTRQRQELCAENAKKHKN